MKRRHTAKTRAKSQAMNGQASAELRKRAAKMAAKKFPNDPEKAAIEARIVEYELMGGGRVLSR